MVTDSYFFFGFAFTFCFSFFFLSAQYFFILSDVALRCLADSLLLLRLRVGGPCFALRRGCLVLQFGSDLCEFLVDGLSLCFESFCCKFQQSSSILGASVFSP